MFELYLVSNDLCVTAVVDIMAAAFRHGRLLLLPYLILIISRKTSLNAVRMEFFC